MAPTNPVPLAEAAVRYHRESRAASNALEWYRKSAARSGEVRLGHKTVPSFKVGGRWVVDVSDVEQALAEHRAEQERIKQTTADYEGHLLRGADGDTTRTTWGGYIVRGAFHFAWTDQAVALHNSDGLWLSNTCWSAARTVHGREECHRCRDWSSCGQDCTLSAVTCPNCGKSQSV